MYCLKGLFIFGLYKAHSFEIMDKIKPAQYIRLQRKLCNAQVIITVHKMAFEWGLTPEEACYRILNEAIMKEYYKRLNDTK